MLLHTVAVVVVGISELVKSMAPNTWKDTQLFLDLYVAENGRHTESELDRANRLAWTTAGAQS